MAEVTFGRYGRIDDCSIPQAIELALVYAVFCESLDYVQVTDNDKIVFMINSQGANYLNKRKMSIHG